MAASINARSRVDAYGYDGRNPKRVKLAAEVDDADFAAVVTQSELLRPKTFFGVGDVGTILTHQDLTLISGETERYEIELYGFMASKRFEDTDKLSKIVFYDTNKSSDGTHVELFSIGLPPAAGFFNVNLPSPVRFENGISMRGVNVDNTLCQPIDIVTLFYREVTFNSHYVTPAPHVNVGDSIQAAIDNAQEGELIIVDAGTYVENILLNKNGVTLLTTSDAVITGTVRLEANNITIDGFTLTGSQNNDRGLAIAGGSNIVVQNMRISTFTTGASMDFASQLPTPSNVVFLGNTFVGNTSGIGSTENVSGLLMNRNRFESNQEGVGLGQGVTLADNATISTIFNQNLFYGNVVAVADYRQGSPPEEYDNEGNSAEPVSGQVVSVAITEPGQNYLSTPSVTFSEPTLAGGVTAQGEAVVNSAQIASITIIEAGSGYEIAPTVTIGPPDSGGVQATAVATISQ